MLNSFSAKPNAGACSDVPKHGRKKVADQFVRLGCGSRVVVLCL
jgi:hypothetical protein